MRGETPSACRPESQARAWRSQGARALLSLLFPLYILLACIPAFADGPYLATGIKIGEVTPDSAIVWVRLTRDAGRVGSDAPEPVIRYKDPKTGKLLEDEKQKLRHCAPVVEFPNGSSVDTIAGAVPGAPGAARVVVTPEGGDATATDWLPVDPDRDFTRAFPLAGLKPATRHALTVETRGPDGAPGQTMDGGFRTAPPADAPARVRAIITTCHRYPRRDLGDQGYKVYAAMSALDPDFFIHTGDILYYDERAKSTALARWHWQQQYSLPSTVAFHRNIAAYFMKDDHDTWQNDCWPGMKNPYMGAFTFEQGLGVFLEQVPMGEKTHRSARWGRDLEVWMVEGRDFRSPNDLRDGPGKSIWGEAQKAWFKRTVAASDATFRVLVSPTPVVGPDRDSKNDNHANDGFAHEGRELRAFLASQKNMITCNGDRHWQYTSRDPETGLREFSCGPATNEHAGGWPPDDRRPEHLYLNVVGGFLSLEVDRPGGVPTLTARFHDVDGKVLYEEAFPAQP